MSLRKLRVKVERTYNRYSAKDVLIVEETDDVKAEVKAGLLTVQAVEFDPAAEARAEKAAAKAAKAPAAKKPAKKSPAKKKAAK